jgi:hypothetical protein
MTERDTVNPVTSGAVLLPLDLGWSSVRDLAGRKPVSLRLASHSFVPCQDDGSKGKIGGTDLAEINITRSLVSDHFPVARSACRPGLSAANRDPLSGSEPAPAEIGSGLGRCRKASAAAPRTAAPPTAMAAPSGNSGMTGGGVRVFRNGPVIS